MKTILKALLVLGLALGLTTASMVDQAEARRGRGAGIALGVGIGLLGAYALTRPAYGYSYSSACYPGPERCGHVGRRCWENRYGEVVCKGGEWRCYRPTICP